MCCHRLVIYTTCGHSFFSPRPITECRNASVPPNGSSSTACELFGHPYRSWRLGRLCPTCQYRRETLLSSVEQTQEVRFDEWKWKVSYGMPAHGKAQWTKKAEEREAQAAKENQS